MFSVSEIFNLTIADLQGLDNNCLKVEGWTELSHETQVAVLDRLRDLTEQREDATATGIDASALEEQLQLLVSRVDSQSPTPSRSPTPVTDTASDLVWQSDDFRKEREAFDALVQDGYPPSHPVELGWIEYLPSSRLEHYERIISYWQTQSDRYLFSAQLREWEKFRFHQRKVRQFYRRKNKPFSDYQRVINQRRERNGLADGWSLEAELPLQTRLQDWVEFQDCKLQMLERLEGEIASEKSKVNAARKALEELGAPHLELSLAADDFHLHLDLAVRNSGKLRNALDGQIRAQKALEATEKSLEKALSDNNLEELEPVVSHSYELRRSHIRTVDLTTMIEEVESARQQLEEAKVEVARMNLQNDDLNASGHLAAARRKLSNHKILVQWTEEQRRVMASERAIPRTRNNSFIPLSHEAKQRIGLKISRASLNLLRKRKRQAEEMGRTIAGFVLNAKGFQTDPPSTCRSGSSGRIDRTRRPSSPWSGTNHGTPPPLGPVHTSRISKPRRVTSNKRFVDRSNRFTRRVQGKDMGANFPKASRKESKAKRSPSNKRMLRRSSRIAMQDHNRSKW